MGTLLGNTQTLFTTLCRVFSRPRYVVVAVVIGVGLLMVLSFWPHLTLLKEVLGSDTPVSSQLHLLWTLFIHLGGNTSLFGGIITLAIGVLFGVQSALLLFYIRRRQQGARHQFTAGAASFGGLVASLFGVGCAACGSIIATAFLGLFGATGVLTLLPFHGLEFSILGVITLLWSILFLTRHINDPLVCVVE